MNEKNRLLDIKGFLRSQLIELEELSWDSWAAGASRLLDERRRLLSEVLSELIELRSDKELREWLSASLREVRAMKRKRERFFRETLLSEIRFISKLSEYYNARCL